jgi:tripartite-type tricarboxylate transporter receptor subunit TctC
MASFSRRRALLLCAAMTACAAGPALAQDAWTPSRPIRMVLGYTPGGSADQVARDLAPVMEKALGQPVVIDYKPGAGGAIAAELVAAAPADGTTIGLLDGGPLTIVPNARKVPYDPVTSFSYIGLVSQSPLVFLVHPSLPVHDIPELLALLRKSPGALSYSSSGLGTIHQLSGELLKASTRTFMVHVPYRGAGPAMNDLMAGEVKVSVATIGPAVPVVQQGRARAIAVTSLRPVPALPGVRPVAEQGVPGFDAQGVFVIAGPKGMPAPVVARLNAALNTALTTPSVRDRMVSFGSEVAAGTPQVAADLMRRDFDKWGRLMREQNLRFD